MTLLVALLAPVLAALGMWQLDRADVKRQLQDRFFERMSGRAEPPPATLDGAAFRRVTLTGRFEPGRYFLVDNRIAAGEPGYWVVAAFAGDDGRRWLVNRGWVAAPSSRVELPPVPVPAGPVTTVGVVWPDTGMVPLLDDDAWSAGWPKRVQRVDLERMATALGGAERVEIRLEPGQPHALGPLPFADGFDPSRHVGYAVQWFALATVLVAGYLAWGFRRRG